MEKERNMKGKRDRGVWGKVGERKWISNGRQREEESVSLLQCFDKKRQKNKTSNHNDLFTIRLTVYRKSYRSSQIGPKKERNVKEECCQNQTGPAALFLSNNFWR